ncbi:D-amino acid dehydrogenase [Microvirga sp. W0021]|uniref:D-amino acid dehydrogenase n=1 Tax=Hohaiivirga grylli TaxID=3133970 RepID=A0ABV0BF91_9HYPH
MKVFVLGSGVIGVTSAYYLAKAGHEVTVIDREAGPALETSFANAGEVSPGYSAPWASPDVPLKAIKWLLMSHAPLIIKFRVDTQMISWVMKMLRNCTSARYAENKARMVRIAEYSRDCLDELRRETGITYDERMQGTLQLFRTQKQLDSIGGDIAVLEQFGVPYEVLDRQGCIGAEPALAKVTDKFVGGLRLPNDETGDCHIFTNRLADICKSMGVTFLFNTIIQGFETNGQRVTGIHTDKGVVSADHYVTALGSFSAPMLNQIGLNLPVYPVKGYSITVPVREDRDAPVSTVMDETYKVAITRLGDRIRVGGMAELSGYNLKLDAKRRETLAMSLTDLFPDGSKIDDMQFWTGMRPMTPDGTPIIGPTSFSNLTTATGHGTLGWTMACGTGRLVADIVSGRKADIETADLSIKRYSSDFTTSGLALA